MSVREYVKQFNALSKYGTELFCTLKKKNDKFVMRLRKEIQNKLLSQLYLPFEEIVDAALRYEHVFQEDQKEKGKQVIPFAGQKRKFPT